MALRVEFIFSMLKGLFGWGQALRGAPAVGSSGSPADSTVDTTSREGPTEAGMNASEALGQRATDDDEDEQGVTALMAAARANDKIGVTQLVQSGAAVTAQDEDGFTAVRHAVEHNATQALAVLIASGASVDVQDKIGDTCLKRAVELGHSDIIGSLLQAPADPTITNDAGMSAIHAAAKLGRLDLLKRMVQAAGSPPPDELRLMVEGRPQEGGEERFTTPLHVAAEAGHVKVVNYLFSYRPGGSADPDRQDSEGETALHKAAKKGRLEVVELLLKHHAGVSIKDDQGNTAAHYAAKNPAVLELILGHMNSEELLTANNLSLTPLDVASQECKEIIERASMSPVVRSQRSGDNSTQLMMACCQRDLKRVQEILRAGTDDVNAWNVNKLTALHVAVERDQIDIVRELLKAGAHINVQEVDGESPLYLACANGYLELVRLLLARGADMTVHNKNMNTCLHAAASNGFHAVVLELLENGIKTNMRNDKGHTPLMFAVYAKYQIGIVRSLLDHEPDPADVNAVSDGGETALHLAALNGVGQLVQLLLERGAKADAVTHVGRQTALHYAVLSATKTTGPVDIKDAAEVVTVLIRHGKRYLLGKRDADGKTALDLAKDTGVVELHDVLRRAMSEQDEEEEEEEEKDMLAESDDEAVIEEEVLGKGKKGKTQEEEEAEEEEEHRSVELAEDKGGSADGDRALEDEMAMEEDHLLDAEVGQQEEGGTARDSDEETEDEEPPATARGPRRPVNTRTVVSKTFEVIDLVSDDDEDEEEEKAKKEAGGAGAAVAASGGEGAQAKGGAAAPMEPSASQMETAREEEEEEEEADGVAVASKTPSEPPAAAGEQEEPEVDEDETQPEDMDVVRTQVGGGSKQATPGSASIDRGGSSGGQEVWTRQKSSQSPPKAVVEPHMPPPEEEEEEEEARPKSPVTEDDHNLVEEREEARGTLIGLDHAHDGAITTGHDGGASALPDGVHELVLMLTSENERLKREVEVRDREIEELRRQQGEEEQRRAQALEGMVLALSSLLPGNATASRPHEVIQMLQAHFPQPRTEELMQLGGPEVWERSVLDMPLPMPLLPPTDPTAMTASMVSGSSTSGSKRGRHDQDSGKAKRSRT